jgi:glycosyltransferase involved in cell wall biosynthesis
VVQSRVSPKISIVTAVLNRARSIERTLASVREQEYPNVEHVVVDGGSTDGTLEILERSEGIRWISEPDEGLADAMNKGIAMATGDWIGWLNSDDYYLPGALNTVAEMAGSQPDARWIVGTCRIIGADDREIRTAITAYKNWLLRHYSFRLYLTQNFVSCPSTFVRKDAYEEAGPLDPRYRISMDYDVFLRIARRWDPVILDQELAVFRMEEGTLSIEGFEQQFAEHAEQARRHGAGHPIPVTANQLISRGIVLVYRLLRARRRFAQPVSAT